MTEEVSKKKADWTMAVVDPERRRHRPVLGKGTVALVAWLGSWLALHLALRGREVDVKRLFCLALVLLIVATLLLWPPVWPILGGG